MNRRWLGVLTIIGLGAGAIFLFRDQLGSLNQEDLIRLSYLVLLAVFIGGGAFAFRERLGVQVRNALIWLAILFGILGAYTLRDEFSAMLNPSAPRAAGESIELRRAGDGHFWADVEINGVRTRMMIDTGATMVALTPRDARRIGLDVANLRYVVPVATANGRTFAAPVALDSMRIGTLAVQDVPASVMREDSDVSLLGMSFLDRLGGYDVRSDALLLHPPR